MNYQESHVYWSSLPLTVLKSWIPKSLVENRSLIARFVTREAITGTTNTTLDKTVNTFTYYEHNCQPHLSEKLSPRKVRHKHIFQAHHKPNVIIALFLHTMIIMFSLFACKNLISLCFRYLRRNKNFTKTTVIRGALAWAWKCGCEHYTI